MNHSPLARLPPELRNNVYELALQQSNAVTVCLTKSTMNHASRLANIDNTISLLQTCTQIRTEATQLFFSVNCFTVALDADIVRRHGWARGTPGRTADLLAPLRAFEDAIGEKYTSLLSSVVLRLGSEGSALSVHDFGPTKDRDLVAAVSLELRRWVDRSPGRSVVLAVRVGIRRACGPLEVEVGIRFSKTQALGFEQALYKVREAYGDRLVLRDDVWLLEGALEDWRKFLDLN